VKPTFFAKPADFRAWLEQHHADVRELLVGFHKRDSKRPSLTWPESVDAALCFGWIDGVRKRIDEESYTIRFTPRKPRSTWSLVNVQRMRELAKLGLVQPAGNQAFGQRVQGKSGTYAYEQKRVAELEGPYARKLKANKKAWAGFQTLPPWYRNKVCWWVMSAKKEETRLKRLDLLIEDSASGKSMNERRGV
jgi:uncharacterized protein YdeI (YjbR/CyaY-like superfamily)